ncbi:PilZ domain-containing protein [Allohahella marinimesophila]|uniref:PilZ domain-containing protein n=1 Tax=Allohahella marinimesophila TaxID=1054972 RepID=A0ABP7P733_9GAMM
MTQVTPSEGKERRRTYRYPSAELRTKLRTKRGLFGESWDEVSSKDFNHQGISIISPDVLKEGASILLSIELVMEMGSVTIPKLSGIVRHVKTVGRQYRYGIEFDSSQKGQGSESLQAQLLRIEELVDRAQSVAKRIQQRNSSDS